MEVDNIVPLKKSGKKKNSKKNSNKTRKDAKNKNNKKTKDVKEIKNEKKETKKTEIKNDVKKEIKETKDETRTSNDVKVEKEDVKVLNKKEIEEKRKPKVFIPILLTIVLIFSLALIYYFSFSLKLELNGDIKTTINLGSTYEEEYAKAYYLGKDVSKDVDIKNQVNTNKIGEYQVSYTIKEGLIKKTITRLVIVKDLEKPVITLNGDEKVSVCPNATYEDEGAIAIDNLDGDLTSQIQVEIEKDKLIYTVKDKSGNLETIERNIVYEDIEAPKLELVGGKTYTIYQNSTYKDPGYKVTDNCDKNLDVKVTSNVKTTSLGTYTVTYEVTDSNNNKTTVKREVKVIKKYTPPKTTASTPTTKKGVIYLTFDDGPKSGTTNVILDVLKKYGVKATFFVTSSGPDSLIKREYNEGHTVALHTYTHNYKTVYSSVDAYFNDLTKIQNRVKKITGVESKIIRFPGGSSNTVSKNYQKGIMSKLVKEVRNRGFNYFDWNVDSNDAGGAGSATAVYNNVIRGLSKNRINVVLMHDVKTTTKNAIEDIIKYGKNNGYTFEAITMSTPMVIHSVNN